MGKVKLVAWFYSSLINAIKYKIELHNKFNIVQIEYLHKILEFCKQTK